MKWFAHLHSSDLASVVLFGVTPDETTGLLTVLYLCLGTYLTDDEYTLMCPKTGSPVCLIRLPREVLEYPTSQVFKDLKLAYQDLEINP